MSQISFRNPLYYVWGFHCHNDVNKGNDLANALLVQRGAVDFLRKHDAPIDRCESYWPGYGPHSTCMWEVRVEKPVHADIKQRIADARSAATTTEGGEGKVGDIRNVSAEQLATSHESIEKNFISENGKYNFVEESKKILALFGRIALWMFQNNRGQGGYLHVINHDESLDLRPMMLEESLEHQNMLFFGKFKKIDIDFFLSPPWENGTLKDTRTHAIMTQEERDELMKDATHGCRSIFRSDLVATDNSSEISASLPSSFPPTALFIERGFRVFVNFSGRSVEQRAYGFALYEALLKFLEENGQAPDEKWIEEDSNRADAGFCLTFLKSEKKSSADICSNIGFALNFLIMNRGSLDVSMIPAGFGNEEIIEKVLKHRKTFGATDLAFVGQPPSLMGREIRFETRPITQ